MKCDCTAVNLVFCRVITQMRVFDSATNHWTVIHPLRTAYYSFISAVLFFLPIVTMTVAYVLIIWKLWSSKRPGEALGPELKTYDNVKKRVNIAHSSSFHQHRFIVYLFKTLCAMTSAGVAISPIICKVFEHCLLDRLKSFLLLRTTSLALKRVLDVIMPFIMCVKSLIN